MDSEATKLAAVLLCCLAGVASGAFFCWTGNGDGTSWGDEDNWTVIGPCQDPCYPRTPDDDAVIDEVVTITLTEDETIDDLNISGGFDILPTRFTTDSNAWTVNCDTITFSGVWVEVRELAALEINDVDPC